MHSIQQLLYILLSFGTVEHLSLCVHVCMCVCVQHIQGASAGKGGRGLKKGVCVLTMCACELVHALTKVSLLNQYCALQAGVLRLAQVEGWQPLRWEGWGTTQQ